MARLGGSVFRGLIYPSVVLAVLLTGACAPSAPAPPAAAAKPAGPTVDRTKLEADAKAEGKLTWYTSADLPPAQALAKAFETKYGISVEVVRTGSEALFSRYMKEIQSNIHAPDVIHTSDESNFLELKEKDLLAPWSV